MTHIVTFIQRKMEGSLLLSSVDGKLNMNMCNSNCYIAQQGGVVTFYPEEEDGRLQWMRVEHV